MNLRFTRIAFLQNACDLVLLVSSAYMIIFASAAWSRCPVHFCWMMGVSYLCSCSSTDDGGSSRLRHDVLLSSFLEICINILVPVFSLCLCCLSYFSKVLYEFFYTTVRFLPQWPYFPVVNPFSFAKSLNAWLLNRNLPKYITMVHHIRRVRHL